jgi:S-DNA-T family DNA segregation ATPase FtsK/SpoIIIE
MTETRTATDHWNAACQQRGLPLQLATLDGGEWGVMSAEDRIVLLPTGTRDEREAVARAEAFARGLDLGLKAGRARAEVSHRRDIAAAEADADSLHRQLEELESILDATEKARAAAEAAEVEAAAAARIEAEKMDKLRREREAAERAEREILDRQRAEREMREAERRLREAEDRAIQEATRKAREAEQLEARIAEQARQAEERLEAQLAAQAKQAEEALAASRAEQARRQEQARTEQARAEQTRAEQERAEQVRRFEAEKADHLRRADSDRAEQAARAAEQRAMEALQAERRLAEQLAQEQRSADQRTRDRIASRQRDESEDVPHRPLQRPGLANNLLGNIAPPLASFIPALAGITPADRRTVAPPPPPPVPVRPEAPIDIPPVSGAALPARRQEAPALPDADPLELATLEAAVAQARSELQFTDDDFAHIGTGDFGDEFDADFDADPAADDDGQADDSYYTDEPVEDDGADGAGYTLPAVELLTLPQAEREQLVDDEALDQNAELLGSVLQDFNIKGEIVDVCPGPVVTLYEFEPAPGLKSSRIIGLADDIARSMSAVAVRIAVVPGRTVIGIELPNDQREMVYLGEMLRSPAYMASEARLPLVLGKDISGAPVVADLARMPHLLIAGTTGSGKSVGINAMILSLLYRHSPHDCRLIMIDPKMLELSVYDGIPHLLTPVVTDPKKAVVALKWAVKEMEDRYRSMAQLGVRNIEGYNARVAEMEATGERPTRRIPVGVDRATGQPIFEEQPIELVHLPYIVVVVDEMADLMLVAGKEIEACIQRLAQMARAAGIHIIMATQRPSVDVITGTIKANFPTRISFSVTSKIDSRTILGDAGAEQLLGQGDMLYMVGGGRLTRVHGPFVSDSEVEHVVNFLKAQGVPTYIDGITREEGEDEDGELGLSGGSGDAPVDELFDQAVAIIMEERKVSTSFIQRKLQIGYNRAARLVEQMEEEGIISAPNHVGKREILARMRDY